MVDKQRTFDVHVGDTSIPAKTLNAVIQATNQFNQIGVDGNSLDHSYDDGVTRGVTYASDDSPETPDYEFKVIQNNSTSITVTHGHWVRNGFDTNAATETVLVVPDSTDQFLIVELDSAGVYDNALQPSTCSFAVEAIEPTEDEFDTKTVIARINTSATAISSIFQIRTGGRKEDTAIVPDAETDSAAAPVRKTIQFNPAEAEHRRELELHNVSNAYASSTSVPYISTGADIGSGKGSAGDLAWASLDANLSGYDNESLELHSVVAPAPVAGKKVVQIYGFETAASIGSGMIVGSELLLAKDNGAGQSVEYVSIDDLATYIDSVMNCASVQTCVTSADWICTWLNTRACLNPVDGALHSALDYTNDMAPNGGCNWDHAYYHPVMGAAYNDTEGAPYFQSIGRGDTPICDTGSADSLAIDLVNSELWDGTAMALDWENRWFEVDAWTFGCSSPVTILSPVISTTSGTGGLIVAGGVGIGQDINIALNANVGGNAFITGECRADDFKLIDAAATNIWNAEELLVTTSAMIDLNGGTGVRIEADGGDVDIFAPNNFGMNGYDGVTITGAGGPVFEKGIFINSDSWTRQKIEISDGAGGTKEFWVIGVDA